MDRRTEPRELQAEKRIDAVRRHRTRPDADRSMGFIKGWFARTVAKPHRQLGKAATAWETTVPEALRPRTRLVSLSRGTLRVEVDSSAVLYELDALRRTGLERAMQAAGAGVRRIKLVIGAGEPHGPAGQ
ncbi:MAG: DciA family protein [Planctomycetota bacterium]